MKVKVSYGYTFNRGNYESERIDASIELDLDIDGSTTFPIDVDAELNDIFNNVKEFVWKKGGKL